MTKKGILLLVAVAAVAVYTAFDWSCSGCTKQREQALQVLTSRGRDCTAEYEAIANKEYFYSAAGAVAACDTFLSHFQYKRCAYNDEVRDMRTAFAEMGTTLGKSYYSYEQFKSETHYMSQQLAESPYRVVRETWARLLREEDSCRLRASLVSLTSHDFSVYLHDYAQQVCQERYGKGVWRTESLNPNKITQPTLVEGKAAVACTAAYDIYLVTLLIIRRTERLTVSGELGYTPEGKLTFHRSGYSTQ